MAAAYPYNVSGWVTRETGLQIDEAVKRGPSKAKLVRMALESFMRRYNKPRGGAHAELLAGVEAALARNPGLEAELEALAFGKKKPRK